MAIQIKKYWFDKASLIHLQISWNQPALCRHSSLAFWSLKRSLMANLNCLVEALFTSFTYFSIVMGLIVPGMHFVSGGRTWWRGGANAMPRQPSSRDPSWKTRSPKRGPFGVWCLGFSSAWMLLGSFNLSSKYTLDAVVSILIASAAVSDWLLAVDSKPCWGPPSFFTKVSSISTWVATLVCLYTNEWINQKAWYLGFENWHLTLDCINNFVAILL